MKKQIAFMLSQKEKTLQCRDHRLIFFVNMRKLKNVLIKNRNYCPHFPVYNGMILHFRLSPPLSYKGLNISSLTTPSNLVQEYFLLFKSLISMFCSILIFFMYSCRMCYIPLPLLTEQKYMCLRLIAFNILAFLPLLDTACNISKV